MEDYSQSRLNIQAYNRMNHLLPPPLILGGILLGAVIIPPYLLGRKALVSVRNVRQYFKSHSKSKLNRISDRTGR